MMGRLIGTGMPLPDCVSTVHHAFPQVDLGRKNRVLKVRADRHLE